MNKNIYSYTLDQMRELLVQNGFAKYAADQIYNWLYKQFVYDLDEWTNISKKIKLFFKEQFELTPPKIIWHGLSKDGTRKFLVQLSDKKSVEAVMIPAKNNRHTICLSSQVGCAIGCTFCHTGTMGLTRNLEAGEIVGQFMALTHWIKKNVTADFRLTNIVYMGQGEPLHNYDNVKDATLTFMEAKGLGIGQRKITLSTSGLVPQIEKLWDFPPVNIAISLHAAHDNIRSELMPINKAYDLERLFQAIDKIPLKAYRRITYEYLLIKDLNDRQEDIDALSKLLKVSESKINLIPFNEYPESKFRRPSDAKIEWFQNELIKRNFTTTTRTSRGGDILAACGQLKSKEDQLNLWE